MKQRQEGDAINVGKGEGGVGGRCEAARGAGMRQEQRLEKRGRKNRVCKRGRRERRRKRGKVCERYAEAKRKEGGKVCERREQGKTDGAVNGADGKKGRKRDCPNARISCEIMHRGSFALARSENFAITSQVPSIDGDTRP
eukprot:5108920-Pleurochrysis_carterae.AAC.1